jgi:hypothetical protein
MGSSAKNKAFFDVFDLGWWKPDPFIGVSVYRKTMQYIGSVIQ